MSERFTSVIFDGMVDSHKKFPTFDIHGSNPFHHLLHGKKIYGTHFFDLHAIPHVHADVRDVSMMDELCEKVDISVASGVASDVHFFVGFQMQEADATGMDIGLFVELPERTLDVTFVQLPSALWELPLRLVVVRGRIHLSKVSLKVLHIDANLLPLLRAEQVSLADLVKLREGGSIIIVLLLPCVVKPQFRP